MVGLAGVSSESLSTFTYRLKSDHIREGPHALACAARLPGCRGALVVAGITPYDLYTAEGLDWLEGQGEDSELSLMSNATVLLILTPKRHR